MAQRKVQLGDQPVYRSWVLCLVVKRPSSKWCYGERNGIWTQSEHDWRDKCSTSHWTQKWWGISSTTRRWKPSWTGELETLRVVLNGRNKRASTPIKKVVQRLQIRGSIYSVEIPSRSYWKESVPFSLISSAIRRSEAPNFLSFVYNNFFPFRSMFRLSFLQ